jgi:hypothetical protein
MISRLKRVSRGGWITFGVVVGAIIGPGVALAAFSDVRIVGIGGTPPAQVSQANQLLAAETSPARIRRFNAPVNASSPCKSFNAPAPHSFMLTQAVIDIADGSAPGAITVHANKTCSARIASATHISQGGFATTTIPFEPGVPIRAGGGFSVHAEQTIGKAFVYLLGYTMPANAVP